MEFASARRTLHVDEDGLRYDSPEQRVQVTWPEVQAIVAAAVEAPGDDVIPALGLVLRMPFPQPVLVDGAGPNLDYAIPLDALGRRPLLGVHVAPQDIMSAAAEYARAAGVAVVTSR
ncbi:MAG TPA: hypothetical protein VFS62_10230 [Chloroflexota bacterium]|jgi:hypothetical protein|nr:hypothetical protein [Chloroflexota bacterium]